MSEFTYKDKEDQNNDKALLNQFLVAINGSKSSLKLDSCRCWTIEGTRGNAYTWGDGVSWLLVVSDSDGLGLTGKRSARKWNNLKTKLLAIPGTSVTQDGDEGGVIRFTDLQAVQEHSEAIRKAIGLRQTKEGVNNLPSAVKTSLIKEGFQGIFC